MSQRALQEYLELMRKRYQEAGISKLTRGAILDQVCYVAGFSRDHARRVLRGRSRVRCKRPGPKSRYGALLRTHLIQLWVKTGYLCSKRLKAALPLWLPYYDAPDCTQEIRTQLCEISPATIDRILAPYRRNHTRGMSSTRAGHLLKNRIPLKILGEIAAHPGFVEADTVAHCGESLAGEFIHSLTLTDLFSGWTENRATWNKRQSEVLHAIQDIERNLPFDLSGFSSDNGGEFLNEGLLQYFQASAHRKQPVAMTRSRAYRKNDNARVEQKNWTHVRQLFGYQRLDRREWVELMNEIYTRLWNPLSNFFQPTLKLIRKERVGSQVKKTYDHPRTPYQRLLDSPQPTAHQKQRLREQFKKLDPFRLQLELSRSISHLKELYRKSREGELAA